MTLKAQVLRILSGKTYVSGQSMANALSVSRAAIWKSIKALISDGYVIEAVTNRGYRLVIEPDILSSESIDLHLKRRGCKVIVLDSIDSTNNEAKRLAAGGAPSWTIVTAEMQTGGRGRYGRSFFSPLGCGAYFSVIIRPAEFSLESPTLLTTAMAVAVCRAIEDLTGLKPAIKWVNDVFYGGKKICGILSESVSGLETGTIDSIVVGAGINLLKSPDLPDEIQAVVGSLFESKPSITRAQLISAVINRLDEIVSDTPNSGFMDEYRKRSFLIGKQITFTRSGKQISADAVRIDDSGALIVRLLDGTMEALHSGEVSVRPK